MDGEAEGAEPHGVEVEPLASLNQQRLLGLLLQEGQGLKAGVCDLLEKKKKKI